MGVSFLAPLFLAGLLAVSVPIIVHLIRRHQGKKIVFPSLMFIRQIPVQSVKRLRVRDWPLLILRALALALIILAFSRPVFRLGSEESAAGGDGFREVVIALDRSWSMSQGDRWERALDAAREAASGMSTQDRVSLVIFDGAGRVAVEPTLDPTAIRAVLDTLTPGWGSTRIGTGLQAAGGIVNASDRSTREVVLISDFQRRGWEDGPRDRLPSGTRLITIDVGDDGIGSLLATEVRIENSFVEDRQRVQPIVRVARMGENAPATGELIFEMDGRVVETIEVDVSEEGASEVAFAAVTLPEAGFSGSFRLEPDGAPAEEPFRFFFSPREILTVLLLDAGRGAPYLRNALSLTGGAPITVRTRTGNTVSAADLSGVDLVVLNDLPLPGGASGTQLRNFVESGGGLFIVAGGGASPAEWEAAWDEFLPGRPGTPVERNTLRGGTLASVDRDHPVFAPLTTGIGDPRFFRYRTVEVIAPATSAAAPSATQADSVAQPSAPPGSTQILASFDDGTPALLERSARGGKVLLWTSTLDNSWGDFPLHPVFVPVVQEIVRSTSGKEESIPYFEVGQPLDARFLLGEPGRTAGTSRTNSAAGARGELLGYLVGPSGFSADLRDGELTQPAVPGFYEVRESDQSGPVRRTLAVNMDPEEADPARIDPADLTIAAAPQGEVAASVTAGSEGGDLMESTDRQALLREGEARQSAWRFLLLAAILLLIGETILAGRSKPLVRNG